MTHLVLDFETRSEADLRQVGAWAYSEHPSTEVICAAWKLAGEGAEPRGWINPGIDPRNQHKKRDLLQWALDPEAIFEAHNTAFEYSIWKNVCVARYGWPDIDLWRWRDTMATACYYSLPADLGSLCRVLGLAGKDPAGDRLITKYSKLHLKTAKREIPPEDLDIFLAYCKQDVEQEDQVAEILGDLPEEELEFWLHDFLVGSRGLRLDKNGIAAARAVVDRRAADLQAEFQEVTGGLNPGQVAKFQDWLRGHGVDLPDLRATTLEELLEEGTVENEPVAVASRDAMRALQLRLQFAKASTKKLDAMMRQRGRDGRARFQTRYHGAGTGRNTGTGFQPLNLSKGFEGVDPDQLVRDISLGDPAWLDCLYGDAMDAVGKASRHWIIPDDGRRIMAGDFSSIEAVVNAGLAGEEWKLQLFRDGGDPYCAFASKVVGREVRTKKHPDVTVQDLKDRQKIGKPGELAAGYQGSVGAWRKFDRTDNFTDAEVKRYIQVWRELHPMIVRQWRELEDACLEAVTYPGRETGYRMIGFERVDGWLTMILPDGKRLWYWAPQVRMAWPPWHNPKENEDCAAMECRCEKRPQVTYQARKEGQWRRVSTYGGKLCENAVQATSRQLLKPVELKLEAAGYPQVLGVYDEIVCEVPHGRGSLSEMKEMMEEPVADWCADWPIRAEVWAGTRYKK